MSRSVRLALGTAALAALTLTLRPLIVTAAPEPARPADPQWKQIPEADPPPAPPPPKPLTGVQLTEGLAKAAKRVRMPTIANAPQTLEMRLTPLKPRLENGTRIVHAKSIDLIEPTAEIPDGVYWLLADDAYTYQSYIKIRVNTEKDKLYVADCRLKDHNPNLTGKHWLRVRAPGFDEVLEPDDGHIIFAFRGGDGGSTVDLFYNENPLNWYHKMAFYGCDFGKAG
jgi:hypothetical protein